MNGMMPTICLSDLGFRWNKNSPVILDIASLIINKGEKIFIYGPSGSGKTSLLNVLAGISEPQIGKVNLLGINLDEISARERDQFRADNIGVIFQQFNLLPYLSVLDNVLLRAQFSNNKSAHNLNQQAKQLLKSIGMSAYESTRASLLSVGQQQRVAIARALLGSPQIIIADEPTSALDEDTRDEFIHLLMSHCEATKTTLVFVSHDRQLQCHFDRVIDIRELRKGAHAS